MIRELITKFNRSWSEKMVAARRRQTAPVKIWFDPDMKTERAEEAARNACILGETVDISRTGIAFLVPAIRIKEKYLAGQGRNLNVEIDLPNGKVYLRAVGRRYEKVGMHSSMDCFLVGAHIESLVGHDKETYETFLQNGNRRVAKTTARSLELGID
jgi:c-di-GMP-binding flagellar brake protein YcgR